MENPRALVLFAVLGVAVLPQLALAYARETHKGLTEATIKAYEQVYAGTLDSAQEQRMIQGSWDEDDDWRFMRHFYDPVNTQGLLGQYLTSKVWAQDTEGQGNYNCYADWLCHGPHIGYSDKFFSSPTDFSWDRAIYEYAYGDKVRAAETLGHIVHLLQDATVPAHVRNDPHPSQVGIGDADPYEEYSSRYSLGNIPVPAGIQKISFTGIGNVFDAIAGFTNKNFVSKDTLFTNYTLPDPGRFFVKDGFLYDSQLGYRLVRVEEETIRSDGHVKKITSYKVTDEKSLISSDYWRILSKKAIETGAGVIDLFFRNVEEEKRTGALKAKNVSAAEVEAKNTALEGFKFVKALYGSSLEQSDVADLLNDNAGQAGAAALAVGEQTGGGDEGGQTGETGQGGTGLNGETDNTSDTPVEDNSPELPKPVTFAQSQNPAPPSTPTPSGLAPGFGGGGGSSSNSSGSAQTIVSSGSTSTTTSSSSFSSSSSAVTIPLSVTSPSDNSTFATTSVTFFGTSSSSVLILIAEGTSIATTSADVSGNWTLPLTFAEGSHLISLAAYDGAGNSSATTTLNVLVDTAAPNPTTASVAECSYSIVAGLCVVAATTVSVSWSTVADASYYGVFKNGLLYATTSALALSATVSDQATSTFEVVTYDVTGNAATSSAVSIGVYAKPLIINEIGYGINSSLSADQFIELKNISPYILDLSHISILRDGANPIALSGTLASRIAAATGFLVVEATDAVPYGVNEFVTPFTALSSSGEQLSLVWASGSATTTLDATPAVATCGGWCAGQVNAQLGTDDLGTSPFFTPLSMERASDNSDGLLAASWHSTDTYGSYFGNNEGFWGTPGIENSTGLPEAGWYCGSDSALVPTASPGPSYHPSDLTNCTYLSRFISKLTLRAGDLFRGDVGSSTSLTGNFFGGALAYSEAIPISNPQSGEHFFVVLWEMRQGPAFNDDPSNFIKYFTLASTSAATVTTPPHQNYRIIPWVYSP